MSKFATPEHITMFGRTLWNAYRDLGHAEITGFVTQKLLCGRVEPGAHNIHHVFAMLSARPWLEPCKTHSAEVFGLISEAVNSHLRLAKDYDEATGLLFSICPSEPVVADTTAVYLMRKDSSGSGIVWPSGAEVLADQLLSRGVVDKRTRGELYALDNMAKISFGASQPLSVISLFQLLFWRDIWSKASKSSGSRIPTRSGRGVQSLAPFQQAFRDAFITFNNFTTAAERLPQDSTLIRHRLHEMLRKHQAIQLHPLEESWDLLIPMYWVWSTNI
jgi:hypothetical protein